MSPVLAHVKLALQWDRQTRNTLTKKLRTYLQGVICVLRKKNKAGLGLGGEVMDGGFSEEDGHVGWP